MAGPDTLPSCHLRKRDVYTSYCDTPERGVVENFKGLPVGPYSTAVDIHRDAPDVSEIAVLPSRISRFFYFPSDCDSDRL